MRNVMIGVLLCTGLFGCSSDDGKKSNGAAGGGSAGSSTAGATSGGGGMGGGSAGSGAGGGGQATAGGTDANWPTYEEAEASPQSTRVLVLLLDFADSDQNQLIANAEAAWGSMMFGREQANGNHYWYQTSGGKFQLLPAAETQLTPNNGVVHIKTTANKPTSGVLVAEEQPWLTEALDKSAEFVDYASFDKSGDGLLSNTELSVLMIINWEFEQIAFAPAQANILLNHSIAGTGVTLERFTRDMYLHSSIGIPMHELAHHVLDLDHTPDPSDHDLMGQGAYWPDPMIGLLHDPLYSHATRPTHLKAIHKVRSGWVTPTELTGSQQGVQLFAPELGNQYNVIKLPVTKGFLLLENRHAAGYDASIPLCNQEAGALFVDDAAQYLAPLDLTVDHTPSTVPDLTPQPLELCDVYALQGHNDTFSFGGWRISNVSAPGPIMTLDIEKLDVVSTIDHYRLVAYYDEAGARVRHEARLEGAASTVDYSKLHGGTSSTGFVSIGISAYYTTGEKRSVSLDTTYTSSTPYFTFANAGEYTNGGAPTPDSLIYATFNTQQPAAPSAQINFKSGTLDHTITFTNLPQN
jgi:M6 family metalloprotease-like protein